MAHRVIAVDWSGRADAGQAETIWVAEVVGGRLVSLRNGRSRAAVVEALAAREAGRITVGLDFSFSFPLWWLREQGLADGRATWRHVRDHGEAILAGHPSPFYGRRGSTAPERARRFRRTEEAVLADGLPAKSVFGLAGAGAVGTGSLRGMPHLLTLAAAGFAIWPFDDPGPRTALEIYPRALTEQVGKRDRATRETHLRARFADQDPVLLERAAGSEDAFDAAVSALVMGAHLGELESLPAAADDAERREGRVWRPRPAG